MNNLRVVREFFGLSLNEVSRKLNLGKVVLQNFELGEQIPGILDWKHLSEYYTNMFNVTGISNDIKPVHFCLSIDYLMNIGITMNDLLVFKWYFENTRPELGTFCVALYNTQNSQIDKKFTDLMDIFEQFGGYLFLNYDGTSNKLIDNRNGNKMFDWRLILYKRENLVIDITDQLSYFDYLVNYTVM